MFFSCAYLQTQPGSSALSPLGFESVFISNLDLVGSGMILLLFVDQVLLVDIVETQEAYASSLEPSLSPTHLSFLMGGIPRAAWSMM